MYPIVRFSRNSLFGGKATLIILGQGLCRAQYSLNSSIYRIHGIYLAIVGVVVVIVVLAKQYPVKPREPDT